MLDMLVGIYIGIAIMGAIVAAIAGLSAPVAAPKTNIVRAPAPAVPEEKVATAPASPNRPASLIAGLKKRFNLWQTRIHKKKVIASPSPPPSTDVSEELPATGGIVIPEPGAAAPDLLENMPPLPLPGRESLAPAPAAEEPDTNVPDTPVAPVPNMTTEETVEGGEPEPDVPGIAPIAVDSALPDEESAVIAAPEPDVTDSFSGEPAPEEVPFAATDEAETEIALPELADIELPLGIQNDQQISEDVTDSSKEDPTPEEMPSAATDEAETEIVLPELAAIELPLGIQNDQQISEDESEMNMPDGNEAEPVEVAAEDQPPEESEEADESSDEKDQKRSSGSSIFDLFTEEVAEETDTSRFAATLDNVDVLDLLKEAQNFKKTLGGNQR